MKALKDGMLQKEQKNKLVDMFNTPEQRHEILHLIQEDVQNHIESIITWWENTMWTHHDLLIMNLRHIMTEANQEIAGETKHQMIQKTDAVVNNIVQHVSEKIWKNEHGNRNYYSDEQVMHIQLYANLVGNHNIPLDGKRWDIVNGQRQSGILFRLDAQTQEQQITNLYIYQKELAHRDIIMEQRPNESALLHIPNIDDMLDSIGNTALQEKVFQEFLDLFLHIRREWLYFENQIWGDVLQSVLIYMIHAAQYKETSIEDFFDATTQQDIIDSIKEQGYETMWAYFADMANTTKEEIMSINQENIASNQWLALMHTWEQIYQDIDAIEGEIALLLSPHQALAQERRNLANKLKENKITITEYYNALDRIAEKEREADQQMFDQQGRRKDILLRQQVIEKKIELYTMHPTPDARTMICLELKQHFSNEDVQKFLDSPDIRSQYASISYDKYHDAIQAREYELYNTDKEKNILQKRDAVNDIMSQLQYDEEIQIQRPSRNIFQKHFPVEYQALLHDTNGNVDFKDYSVPFNIAQIDIPGGDVLYVKNLHGVNITDNLPPTKQNKKIIIESIKDSSTDTLMWSTSIDIQDIQFAYAHTDNEWNIIVEDLTGNIIKSISPQEQQEAQNTMNKAFLDVMHDYEINKTMRTFNQINERMWWFQHTMEQFRLGGFFANILGKWWGISQEEKEIVLWPLENFAKQTARLQEDVSTRKNILGKLKSIQQYTFGIKNEFEQELETTVERLESLISLFDNEGQKINQFIDMVSKIRENDTGWSALTAFWNEHGLSIWMAIGIAVWALATAKFTAWWSVWWWLKALWSLAMKNTIAVAATWTLWGMIWHRAWQTLNAWRINTFDSTFTNSTLQYRNPTDVERYINGEVTGQEFVTNLAVEFALWTITTAAFIRAWQYVWNAIQKSNSSALKGTQDRIGRMVGYHKDLPPTARISFTKDFVREFSQEVRQESIQWWAEQIGNQAGDGESNILGSLLSWLATIATCMGRGGYASTRRNLWITDSNNTYDRSNQQRIQHQTYDATNRQQLETLHTLYQEAWYSRIHIDTNTWVFRAERKVTEPLVKPNGDKIDTHIVEIAPSNAPSSVRALEHQLQDYQITIDHNSIEQIARYTDIADIQRLKTDIAMSNAGTIVVNQDGTVMLSIQWQTIQIKPQLEQHRDQIENIIQQIESEQAIFNQPTVIEQAKTETEQLRLIDKIQLKIYSIAQAFTVESETELVTKGITYFAENIQHFLHECKMVFGTQLIDVYRSYHQWKANINKPWEAEFQTLFQHKLKERWTNLTKLIGLVTVSKVWIDPHLFFRSWHIMADQLQKHDNTWFFDKLFHLSFDTMNELYGRQEGSKQKYNPMTVIENSTLDNDTKQERLREILALDADNIQHQELLDKLIEAHEIGQNQPGANPAYTAWVYNYTTEQIRAKYSILKPYIDSGQITYEQVKQLFDLGYLWWLSENINDIQEWSIDLLGTEYTVKHLKWGNIDLGWYKLEIIDVSQHPELKTKFQTPYVIIDHALFRASNGQKGYKWLRKGETVTLWRQHLSDRFNYTNTTSRTHATITLSHNNQITIKDVNSRNGTKFNYQKNTIDTSIDNNITTTPQWEYPIWDEVIIPRSDGSTSKAYIVHYDTQASKYLVTWHQKWKNYRKRLSQNALDEHNGFWLNEQDVKVIDDLNDVKVIDDLNDVRYDNILDADIIENGYQRKNFKTQEERERWKKNFDKPIIEQFNGNQTEVENLLDKWYHKKLRQIWLYNEFVDSSAIEHIKFSDWTNGEYKLHISANEENFNFIVKEFWEFFVKEKIWAKCAPGKLVATPEMWGQYGKIFTIYAKNKSEMMKVVEKAKEVYQKGYTGINKNEFISENANLQYEMPIEGTWDLLYYTIEKHSNYQDDWGYIGNYAQRIDIMKKYKWQWPLDHLVVF